MSSLTATDRKPQKSLKGNVNHTNIDIQAMLMWLTLPSYDFCGFRSVAVNCMYRPKLQFLRLSYYANRLCQVPAYHVTNFQFRRPQSYPHKG